MIDKKRHAIKPQNGVGSNEIRCCTFLCNQRLFTTMAVITLKGVPTASLPASGASQQA